MPELIDRNELLRRIYERFGQYSTKVIATVEEGKIIEDWAFLEPFLNAAPTIEAEPVRQGRWILKILPIGGGDKIRSYLCSECDRYANMKFDFCPNCGADMRGGVEE